MADAGDMEAAAPFDHEVMRGVAILEGGDRGLEITRVGEAVGADRAAVGKGEFRPVILADIATGVIAGEAVFCHHAARHNGDMARRHPHPAHFGEDLDLAVLRHDQHFGIGIDQHAVGHAGGDRVDMGRHADMLARVAGAGHGAHAFDEVGWRGRNGKRVPPVLAEWQVVRIAVGCGLPQRHIDLRIASAMAHRRTDAIEPRPLVC